MGQPMMFKIVLHNSNGILDYRIVGHMAGIPEAVREIILQAGTLHPDDCITVTHTQDPGRISLSNMPTF
jgi:hypothetical protein